MHINRHWPLAAKTVSHDIAVGPKRMHPIDPGFHCQFGKPVWPRSPVRGALQAIADDAAKFKQAMQGVFGGEPGDAKLEMARTALKDMLDSGRIGGLGVERYESVGPTGKPGEAVDMMAKLRMRPVASRGAQDLGEWLSRIVNGGKAQAGDGERFANWLRDAVAGAQDDAGTVQLEGRGRCGTEPSVLDSATLRKLVDEAGKKGVTERGADDAGGVPPSSEPGEPTRAPEGTAGEPATGADAADASSDTTPGEEAPSAPTQDEGPTRQPTETGAPSAQTALADTGLKLAEVLSDPARWKALVEQVLGEDCDDAAIEAVRVKLLAALQSGDWAFLDGVSSLDQEDATRSGADPGEVGSAKVDVPGPKSDDTEAVEQPAHSEAQADSVDATTAPSETSTSHPETQADFDPQGDDDGMTEVAGLDASDESPSQAITAGESTDAPEVPFEKLATWLVRTLKGEAFASDRSTCSKLSAALRV